MHFVGLRIKPRFRRVREPRALLRSATFTLGCSAVACFCFVVAGLFFRGNSRITAGVFATSYAFFVVVAGVRVLVLRRRLKRSALLQAHFDSQA
jgi:hypothetical protein